MKPAVEMTQMYKSAVKTESRSFLDKFHPHLHTQIFDYLPAIWRVVAKFGLQI